MKLINFYESKKLNSLLEEMGAELKRIENTSIWDGIDDSKLRELLKTGEVEIELDDIDIGKGGVFEYKGRKVIVYIRDQYAKYYERGYKFHLAKCQTISSAFENRRNSRYVLSLRTDGTFKINLIEGNEIKKKDLIESLNVCKNCLTKINYNDYKNHYGYSKEKIYNDFDLAEYFDKYKQPKLSPGGFKDENTAQLNEYPANWSEISDEIRRKRNYICEGCKIDLSNKNLQKFSHVHHIDADKSNNKETNLKVLCIKCHSKEPGHEWLKHNPQYIEFQKYKSSRYLK